MGYDGKLVVEFIGQMHDTALLTDREKQLIGLAVTMTRGCQICTRSRIEKARAAGIGDEILNALVNVVAAVNAGVTAATAREGFGWPTPPHQRRACTPTLRPLTSPAMRSITRLADARR